MSIASAMRKKSGHKRQVHNISACHACLGEPGLKIIVGRILHIMIILKTRIEITKHDLN